MSHNKLDPSGSFPDYMIHTTAAETGFHVFVLVYVLLSFLLIPPLVIWGRRHERERAAAVARAGFYDQQQEFSDDEGAVNPEPMQQLPHHPQTHYPQLHQQLIHRQQPGGPFRDPRIQRPVYEAPTAHPNNNTSRAAMSSVFRGIDRVAATAYPDDHPDFVSVLSRSQQQSRRSNNSLAPSRDQSNGARSRPSNTPSAATTSRLHQRSTNQAPKTQVWDVHTRRWKSRRPIGRPEVIHQAFKVEVSAMGGSIMSGQERRSLRGGSSRRQPMSRQHHLSDVASSILTDELEGPPLAQQRVILNYHLRHGSAFSVASSDRTSNFLRNAVDDIAPEDAADAADPGRQPLAHLDEVEVSVCCGPAAMWTPRMISAAFDGLVDLSEPDLELQRIVKTGIPLTLGAMAKSVFHLITVAFVANYISTDAMVAYVIVHLLLGLTNELIGAVADAQSTLCSHALSMGNWLLAGQYAQIAIVLTLLVNVPLLLMWAFVMDDLVEWLVQSENIARIAEGYTKVVLIYQALDGVSRALTVLYHLTGNEQFETRFSIVEGIIALIGVTCVSALKDNASLNDVGCTQLIIGCSAFAVKVSYTWLRGWLHVFYKGMLKTFAFANFPAVCTLMVTTIPLLVGAFLEYGEWEILLFFVVSMGPAEVATWAVVGVVWQLLESATEGFGEAAAIRVAFHLGSANPDLARHASQKAILLGFVQALIVTSILMMTGKNIANALTPDPTLQLLLNTLITNVSLGNIVMSTAMNVWSLLGAQGRYRLATLVMLMSRWLVTVPIALVCIYGFRYDLNGVMGAVTTGYATSVLILSYFFLRSDWDRLSKIMQELNAIMEADSDFGDSSIDDDDDEINEDLEEFLEPSNQTVEHDDKDHEMTDGDDVEEQQQPVAPLTTSVSPTPVLLHQEEAATATKSINASAVPPTVVFVVAVEQTSPFTPLPTSSDFIGH